MFKELIEIFRKEQLWGENDIFNGLEKAIEIIKESQEIAFDPELLGFKVNDTFNKHFPYKVYYLEMPKFEISKDKNSNEYRFSAGRYENKICDFKIKVPSHAFGVELLKNLGVIE